MLRILHVGLGPLGVRIVADLHERRLGDIVAALDTAPDIAGRKLADIVPAATTKIRVSKNFDEVGDWKSIDCAIVTTSSSLARCAPTFRELLRRGVSVVSTCEELCWPYLGHAKLAEELDMLAKEYGARLLGTGVNPGFLMDAFPLFATAISKSVTSIEVHRHQDASIRRIPFQKKIGAGLGEREFEAQMKAGTLRHVGLGESLHFLAHAFGFEIERWDEDLAPVRADRDLQSGVGPIAKGAICGVHQEARGWQREKVVVHLKFEAAIGLSDPHDSVHVEGEPPIDIVWKGGVPGDVATSAIVLNSIAPLLAAAPGLHTMATIPLVGCAPTRAK